MSDGKLDLSFGALSEPLSHQVAAQGYKITDGERYDMANDALNRLRIWGYLPDSACEKVRMKLAKAIIKDIRDGLKAEGKK